MEQDKNTIQEKEFNLDFNETKLSIKFTAFSDLIKISLIDGNNNYENAYTLEGLSKVHIIFKAINTIQDLFEHFTSIIGKKQYTLKKVKENEFDLVLKIIFISNIEEVPLQLYKSK